MGSLERIVAGTPERRSAAERRKAQRQSGRGAAVSVAHGSGVNAALCGDVSPSGARLSLDRPLAVGETVTIGFGPDISLTGRVAWVDQAECGIEFEQTAGLPAVREPQTALAKLGTSGFRDGLRVTVMLPDRESKAVLRWTQDNSATVTLQP